MADEISDPEARGVAERAHKTLLRVGAEGQATAPKPASKAVRWYSGSRASLPRVNARMYGFVKLCRCIVA